MTSFRQIAANRRNAAKSTGPKRRKASSAGAAMPFSTARAEPELVPRLAGLLGRAFPQLSFVLEFVILTLGAAAIARRLLTERVLHFSTVKKLSVPSDLQSQAPDMTATTTRRVAYHRGFGSTEATEFFYAHEQIYFLVAKEIFLNAFAAPTTAC
jgi:hypothetical protein